MLHSATKFLCGHGNAVAGAIVEKGDFDWGSGKFPILSEPCDSYHGMSFYEVCKGMVFRGGSRGVRHSGFMNAEYHWCNTHRSYCRISVQVFGKDGPVAEMFGTEVTHPTLICSRLPYMLLA